MGISDHHMDQNPSSRPTSFRPGVRKTMARWLQMCGATPARTRSRARSPVPLARSAVGYCDRCDL